MLKGFVRLAACAASGAAFLALTGCGGAAPDDGYAGPPPSSYDRGGSAPVLMGRPAPARPADDGLLGGPDGFATMAPIPNPGDLTRAERVRFYGHKYDYLPEPKGKPAGVSTSPGPRFQLITRRKADGTLQISMRPIANPEDMSASERRRVYGNRYAPRAVAAAPRRSWRSAPVARPVAAPAAKPTPARPVVVARPAPAPMAKPAPRPVVAAIPAPVVKPVAPVAVAAPVAAKPNPAQQLQGAVSADINRGASLSVPADLKAGKEADVVLALPADLLAMVQAQAAKFGLGKPAKKVDAYANLQGQGYEITPPAQQTVPVAAGKPTTFTWRVKPTQGEKAPLKADYGLELNGGKPKTAFSVGSLEEAIAAPVDAARSAAKGFKLPAFKMPALSLKALAFPWVPEPTLPGGTRVSRENVVGGALALLALLLVIMLARGASASRARAERRRKFRTMKDYGVNEHEQDAHPTSNTGYVNPMVAAAAGAAGGYALASHGHDDHGHDDHGHGHDDHGHQTPGHDAPAHGDDGHGHDDHGRGPAQHVSHDAHGHDDHGAGHGDHAAGHDDHGHGHHDHAHDGDAHGHGHDDHAPAHTAVQPVSHDAHGHDDHGHGHDDHGHAAPGHDGHGHDDHGAGHDNHGHGHDAHHREPEHAH